MNEQIPEFLHMMEVSLRSGYNMRQSMEIVCKDSGGPLAAEVQQVLDEMAAGAPLAAALDHWLQRHPSRSLDLVVATIHVQLESGGNLANKFQFVSQMLPKLKLGT